MLSRAALVSLLFMATCAEGAAWQRPTGIVITAVGGTALLAGTLMLASPDSCRPDNDTDECRRDKQAGMNAAAPVLGGGAALLATGIVLTVKGGRSESVVGVAVDRGRPMLAWSLLRH